MADLKFVDAAFPESITGGPYDGVAGYIGGDTPHIWTKAEWAARPEKFRLPIWVRSNPTNAVEGTDDATGALAQLAAIGAPKGTMIALDSETSIDPSYVLAFYIKIKAGGYILIEYGTQSDVLQNLNPDGYYWGADWTDAPHIHVNDAGTQYVSFANYDVSEFASVLPFWNTKGVTPAAVQTFALAGTIPELVVGVSDSTLPHWYVRRLQAVLNAVWGAGLTVDGNFGASTEAAVKKMQGQYKLTQDGTVGPKTMAVVLPSL
jgi:hypothetical protein